VRWPFRSRRSTPAEPPPVRTGPPAWTSLPVLEPTVGPAPVLLAAPDVATTRSLLDRPGRPARGEPPPAS
jgi:hypothetical protein